jgi:hypothetical protein
MTKITRFPSSGEQRRKNQLGKYSVPCIFSMRWLQFRPESTYFFETGEDFVTLEVMTAGDSGARRLCGMTVHRKDLLEALGRVKEVRAD